MQYHCGDGSGAQDDVIENLDPDFATKVIRTTVYGAASALGM